MRNLLKKLHIMPNQSEYHDGPSSSKSSRSNESPVQEFSPSPSFPSQQFDQKPSLGLSGWLNSVAARHGNSPPLSMNVERERREPADGLGASDVGSNIEKVASDLRNREMDEECQIQLALELSAKEDPEAVQIEAVKQISLGSCPPDNTPAEVVAYRYWNYNALGYDDKISDGFYDLYGILAESKLKKMPSLVDLQAVPISDGINWEAVLVNRADDADLQKVEQRALMMAIESRSRSSGFEDRILVQKLGLLVACYMGGPVVDPDQMLMAWRDLSNRFREAVGNMVLPLGLLRIGLARHRALLFKVLADSVGVPCLLVKGQQYTGSVDGAMNIVKINDGRIWSSSIWNFNSGCIWIQGRNWAGLIVEESYIHGKFKKLLSSVNCREYIVDLMADPGTLIPSDTADSPIEETFHAVNPFPRDVDGSQMDSSSSSRISSSVGGYLESGPLDKRSRSGNLAIPESGLGDNGNLVEFHGHRNPRLNYSSDEPSSKEPKTDDSKLPDDLEYPGKVEKVPTQERSCRWSSPYMHVRSPSWTEGVSSPAVHRMKVKDVSQYMIDAAKENPQLAQKLHDVLLESGVVAPANLFTEIYNEHVRETDEKKIKKNETEHKGQADMGPICLLPPLANQGMQVKANPPCGYAEHSKPLEGVMYQPLNVDQANDLSSSSQSESCAAQLQDTSPLKCIKHLPVAAAAATAAVVVSSMVAAVAKSSTDSNLEVPAAAAATVTAAAVMATTAVVTRQYEQLEAEGKENQPLGVNDENVACEAHMVGERVLDRSTDIDSVRSEITLDDVSEWEIQWEEIIVGERIGLGSYGEVYRGDWHGTEVAVKKFLNQDISGDALEEFRSEVRIMKRLRHPNVVLFMGAVTRAPNLSIVTEFLPRGSLYRLIHRPNNQLDERRRLRMALDVARGMNYLHNSVPVIVHRDLKSPNLLVDKNWVVKVCDFGLSRLKHNTFLSSRSTAGTAEWMAPEVLRNEPSDEKSDVYSFGVILWELATLQQPWGRMNPMQVVGAVGFQHRRLDIPDDMDPVIADVIRKCWQTDPKKRPSFAEIMAALKPLQKPIAGSQVPRPRVAIVGGLQKGPPHCVPDPMGQKSSGNETAEGTDEQ